MFLACYLDVMFIVQDVVIQYVGGLKPSSNEELLFLPKYVDWLVYDAVSSSL